MELKEVATMIRLVLVAASFACVLGAPGVVPRPRHPPNSRIVGGNSVEIEEAPYQLALQVFGNYVCGASIISADWAVTAAHCADGTSIGNYELRSGTKRRDSGGVLHTLSQIIIHENFDPSTNDYDLAVLQVSSPFAMSETTAVIPLAATTPATDTPAVVSGWGSTATGGSLPKDLRWVVVPIYDQEACREAYTELGRVTDRMICAGVVEGGKDFCEGDSGGPLVANGELVGVVSWGLRCAAAGFPGVYTNVAALRDWVNDNTRI